MIHFYDRPSVLREQRNDFHGVRKKNVRSPHVHLRKDCYETASTIGSYSKGIGVSHDENGRDCELNSPVCSNSAGDSGKVDWNTHRLHMPLPGFGPLAYTILRGLRCADFIEKFRSKDNGRQVPD